MGKPAARIGDMHVCPMFDGPKPHVGGPIIGPGVPNVLIGGMPAAVMGDMCVCVGPPDMVALGSTGVLIGGRPAARMGDQCAHGGRIIIGMPTVLIGEVGKGSVGMSSITMGAMQNIAKTIPKEVQKKLLPQAAQVITMMQAAENGSAFCEKCD